MRPENSCVKVGLRPPDDYNGVSFANGVLVACPYFMPSEKFADGAWIHPARLPLGGGWRGYCTAPGHEGELPSDEELHHACNLGYAAKCPRRPVDPSSDSVRFVVTRNSEQRVLLGYALEKDHVPCGHGTLEFDAAEDRWTTPHADERIQKMAECYLSSYMLRRNCAATVEPLEQP